MEKEIIIHEKRYHILRLLGHGKGGYTQITDVYTAVIAWMEANGYEPAEPMFNIYHVSPHETQNPDEFVTEICYPVKKK